MKIYVDNVITVENPTEEVKTYCKENLTVINEDYTTRVQQCLWLGRTAKYLDLYKINGNDLILPFGALEWLYKNYRDKAEFFNCIQEKTKINYPVPTMSPLDYQSTAISAMAFWKNGILQSPAGSGKSFMALSIIQRLGLKALFICHTLDLIKQAKNYAINNFGLSGTQLGEITEGKIQIGTHITFATRQTLARKDLTQLKDIWGIIIVDEVHNAKCNEQQINQYTYIMNNLSARYKIGLSATVEVKAPDKQKMIKALFGEIKVNIPKEFVAAKVIKAKIKPIYTGFEINDNCLTPSGTIDNNLLMQELTENKARNAQIATLLSEIIKDDKLSVLVLSCRVKHLKALQQTVGYGEVIDGTMTSKAEKEKRASILQAVKEKKVKLLFATYQLAKEGLDIPCLNRLFLVTPTKDKSTIIQSVGRIERKCDGKCTPIVYDYVDGSGMFLGSWKKRKGIYKTNGNEVER